MTIYLISFAFFFGLAIRRIGLPPMVGFLLAGFAYNYAGLDVPSGLQTVADLGVTLLLFSIGLKLKLDDLATIEVWGTSVLHLLASTVLFSVVILLSQMAFKIPLFDLSPVAVVVLAFGLSFSSTVYAVKVLEDKGDMAALYGKVAIGILVMQDLFAVLFLTVSEGKYPSIYSILVLALFIPPIKKIIYKLIDYAGHGELLVLSALFFAMGAGYELFYSLDLKGDLGALILGILISNHPKSKEMAKSLLNFKELMLIGFFLSVGMQGLPTDTVIYAAIGLVLFLPVKAWLYLWITTRFGLRARTGLFVGISLGNYSEFGLIVTALGAAKGIFPLDWLLVMAIAVSVSFALASPFSLKAEEIYHRYKAVWGKYQRLSLIPKDEIIDTGNATILVMGMGRVGLGVYDKLVKERPGQVIGIELNETYAGEIAQRGYNVKVADATDTDFWNMVRLSSPIEEIIVLAMPKHQNNIDAAKSIFASGLDCKVIAIAKYEKEVQELNEMGVASFNLYREAGEGLAREASDIIVANDLT